MAASIQYPLTAEYEETAETLAAEYGGFFPVVQSTDGEHVVTLCRQIVAEHGALEIDGTIVDVQSANAIVLVADNVSPKNRANFIARRTVISMGRLAQNVVFKARNRKS